MSGLNACLADHQTSHWPVLVRESLSQVSSAAIEGVGLVEWG